MSSAHSMLDKNQAFEDPADLKYVNLNLKMHDFRFTRRWFKIRNQSTWSTFLPKRFDNTKPIRMIQIGVFEGMDLIWCLQNILKHKDSRAIAIDPWLKTVKLSKEFMDQCYKNAIHNFSPWSNKVRTIREKSQLILPNLVRPFDLNGIQMMAGEYDLIVIDGDHVADAVYEDAVNSFRLAKPGGWIIFDDFHNRIDKKNHVQDGVRRFLDKFGKRVKLEWQHRFSVCFSKI